MASLLLMHREERKFPLNDLESEQDGCCRKTGQKKKKKGNYFSWVQEESVDLMVPGMGLLNKILCNLIAVAKPMVSQRRH